MADDYEVGYGKPPRHTRFRKGQSGNPKGRPKLRLNTSTIVQKVLKQPVRVRTANGTRTVTTEEALVMGLAAKAAKGDPRSFEVLHRIKEQGDLGVDAGDEFTSNDKQIIDDYLKRHGRLRPDATLNPGSEDPEGSGEHDDQPRPATQDKKEQPT
jgi:hypothetical protein